MGEPSSELSVRHTMLLLGLPTTTQVTRIFCPGTVLTLKEELGLEINQQYLQYILLFNNRSQSSLQKKNRAQWCLLEGKRLTIKAIVCLSGPMSCMKIWCWEYKSLHFSWVYSICPIFPL